MAERGLIYGRASVDPHHIGNSVSDQIRECRAWAEANGVDVARVVRDDNRSASRTAKREREGFATVLDLIERRAVDILIVWEASRASRNMDTFVELRTACRDAGVALSYKGRRFDLSVTNDAFSATLDALLAEREAGDIRDRNIRTVRRNAEQGRPHGRLPYGYRRRYDPATGVLTEQTPFGEDGELLPEAKVIVEAARAVLRGASLRSICMDLNARGVPFPRKPNRRTQETNPAGAVTVWHPNSLRQRLINPTIAGRRVHRGEDIGPADWPPILEYGDFLKVRAVLTDPSRQPPGTPTGHEPRHLLSSIARCAECGALLKTRLARPGTRNRRLYLCQKEGCRKASITAAHVDEMIEALLAALFADPGFRGSLTAAYARREGARTDAGEPAVAIARLEDEQAELDALRAEGAISLRAYAAEDMRINDAIEQLKERQVSSVTSRAVRDILVVESFGEAWASAGLLDKREIIGALLDIRIHRSASNTGQRFDFDRVEVQPSKFLLDSWTDEDQLAMELAGTGTQDDGYDVDLDPDNPANRRA
jgi:site-specific DNA recombinase